MYTRIALWLSALFCLTMNFLLWRMEFGGGEAGGATVPVELIWRKILTAPDNSALDIYHQGKRQGYCRWTTGAAQAPVPETDDGTLQAAPATNTDFRLSLAGNIILPETTNHVQFDLDLRLAASRDWEQFELRLSTHDGSVAVHSAAAEQRVRLRSTHNGQREEEDFSFAELQNPAALAQALALPLPIGDLGIADLATNAPQSLPELGVQWSARDDWLRIGHSSVRVYRLQSQRIDRYQVVIYVSRVGELLRVELPDGWLLVNDETGGV